MNQYHGALTEGKKLSTADLLIMIACFVMMLNKISIEKAADLNKSVHGGQWLPYYKTFLL
jgi:hypothetical protein